jgi:hypothetical protein
MAGSGRLINKIQFVFFGDTGKRGVGMIAPSSNQPVKIFAGSG